MGIENPTITVYDYAYNSISVCDTDTIEITPSESPNKSAGSVMIKTKVNNTSGAERSAALIAAVYDESGAMKSVTVIDDDALPTGKTIYSFTLKTSYDPNDTVKFFAWDSLSGMMPQGESGGYKMGEL